MLEYNGDKNKRIATYSGGAGCRVIRHNGNNAVSVCVLKERGQLEMKPVKMAQNYHNLRTKGECARVLVCFSFEKQACRNERILTKYINFSIVVVYSTFRRDGGSA